MKSLKKILFLFFVLTLAVFIGLYFFLQYQGKDLLESNLSAILQKNVRIGKVRILFPAGLRFDDVTIQDALKAKTVRFQLGIPLVMGKQIIISKVRLTDPVLYVTRLKDKRIVWGKVVEQEAEIAAATAPAPDSIPNPDLLSPEDVRKNEIQGGILIDRLEIAGGTIQFFNNQDGSEVGLARVDLKALSISYPMRDVNTKFDLTAILTGDRVPFKGQKMESRGWVNVVKRNMDASMTISDDAGETGLVSYLKALNNDMQVKGKVNVAQMIAQMKPKGSGEASLEDFLVTALKSSGIDIGVDFAFNTKLDDFNFHQMISGGTAPQTGHIPAPSIGDLKGETGEKMMPGNVLAPSNTIK